MAQFGTYPLPAPLGGINTVDPISLTPETDAIDLVNLYPDGQRLVVRGGYSEHNQLAYLIESLYCLVLADGTSKLVAATSDTSDTFYDVTDPDAAPTNISGPTAITSAQWNGGTFRNRLWLCNGEDTVQEWAGTGNFADATYTGVTLSTLINQSAYYDRNYFVEKDSSSFWYSGSNAINGGLTEYDVGSFLSRGGKLLFAGSYSNRIGQTTSELFMAVSSEGEALFYQGLYPADTTTPWRLVAHYDIAKPMGYRAFVRVDSDLWIITEQGIIPVSMLFSGQSTVAANTVSRKVNKIIRQAAKNFGFSHYWNGVYKKSDNKVLITIPTSNTMGSYLVCNTELGAWTRYEFGEGFVCLNLVICDGSPFATKTIDNGGSTTSYIYKLEDGQLDDGAPIEFELRTAFSFFGSRQNFKIFKELRPLLFGLGGEALQVGMDTDFRLTNSTSPVSTVSATQTPWYSDWYSSWSSPETYFYDRFGLRGAGHSGSLHMVGEISNQTLEFSVFEVRFEAGAQV